MFENAISESASYTRPIFSLFKFLDGNVESTIGTYIHLNDIGYILSARHIFTVGSETPLEAHSFLFDGKYTSAEIISEDIPNDLILIKLNDYTPGSIKVFPRILSSLEPELPNGTPIVGLGYPMGLPYSKIAVSWNVHQKSFDWDSVNTKVTLFKNSGVIVGYADRDGGARLLESDSAALIGQSGGPVLSRYGFLIGLQSRNSAYELPNNLIVETGLASSHFAITSFIKKWIPS